MGPKLRNLTVKDYRSFVDQSLVEFPESGLVSLNGINKDTGGGSGSGKSNLITAIADLLGFSPLPSTEFKSWYSDKTPFRQLELNTDLGVVGIRRTKTLQLWIDDVEIEGSVGQKEAKIDEIFGMNAEFRKLLTYRGQRQPGSFLSNTDAKKKEFLMQILGLDKFEEALEVGAKNVTRLEGNVATAKAMIAVLETTLSNYKTDENLEFLLGEARGIEAIVGVQQAGLVNLKKQLASLQADIINETNKVLSANKIFYQEALESVQAIEDEPFVTDVDRTELNRLAKMVAACKERVESLTEEDRLRKNTQQTELRKLQEIVDFENGRLAQIPGLEKQVSKLKIEMVKLDAGLCSMCGREWEESVEKRLVYIKELEGLRIKINEYFESKATVVELQKQMLPFHNFDTNPKIAQMIQAKANLESQYAVEKQKIDSQKTIYLSEKNAKIAEAKRNASAILAEGEKAARELRDSRWSECETIGSEVQNLNDDIVVNQNVYSELQKQITRAQYAQEQRALYEPKLAEVMAQMAAYEAELKAEQDFLNLIGREGFLGSIFDEVLVEISDETNNMLMAVANVRHVTIDFKSESLTQKGVINRTIVPVVNVGGNVSTIKSGLSGGMLSVVELATDLAVGKVIATRTGTCPQFLVLDECLDGLGVVEKESALELIQNYAQNRLVIMTDHSSETKALFTKTISIEYSNGRSIIV